MEEERINANSNTKVNCPYCEHINEINPDYSGEYVFERDCENCGKTFMIKVKLIQFFNVSKCDCLNFGGHSYKPCGLYSSHDYGVAFCSRDNCNKPLYTFNKDLQAKAIRIYVKYLHEVPQQIKDDLKKEHYESFEKWKEKKIEACSEICEYCQYCQYHYISDEALQARMCNDCNAYYAEYSNFRGIECTQLTKEED